MAPAARKLEAHGPQQPRRKWHGRWPVWERGEAVTAARAGNKQRGPHTLCRLPLTVGSQGEAPTAGRSASLSLSRSLCLLTPTSRRAGLLSSGHLPGAGEPPLYTRARWCPLDAVLMGRDTSPTSLYRGLGPGRGSHRHGYWPSLTLSIVTRVGPASLQPGGRGHVRLSKCKNHPGNREEACARVCGVSGLNRAGVRARPPAPRPGAPCRDTSQDTPTAGSSQRDSWERFPPPS